MRYMQHCQEREEIKETHENRIHLRCTRIQEKKYIKVAGHFASGIAQCAGEALIHII